MIVLASPVVGAQPVVDGAAGARIGWRLEPDLTGALCLLAYSYDGRFLRRQFCVGHDDGAMSFNGPATFTSYARPASGAAAGPTFSAHNDGSNGGLGMLAQYFSAANARGFDLGAEFIASFNPTTWQAGADGTAGPGDMAQWVVALSPNDSLHKWGTNVVEYDVVNRGPDMGWHRDRSFQPVTGGLVVVPEVSVFGDKGGGEGRNATYAYTAAHSGDANGSGVPARFYNDFLCEPNSEAGGSGRCLYATGDITGVPDQVPYSPLQVDGAWLHGLDATRARFTDDLAMRLGSDQRVGFLAPDGTIATLGGRARADGVSLVLAPAGTGQVELRSEVIVKGDLLVQGRVRTSGQLPLASTGRLDPRSSDARGTITLERGARRVTLTFRTPFADTPFCTLTSHDADSIVSLAAVDRAAVTIDLTANPRGTGVTWFCQD